MKEVVVYIKESYGGLVRKVSWPTYSELANNTVAILYASLFTALVVWGMGVYSQDFMERIVHLH